MNNIIKRKWNQNSMVIIEDLQGMAFQAESGGHTFQISGIDGEGNTVALSGTPAGVMLRSDGQDVTLTCSVSEGVVSATLPANAYSVPGRFGLTIFMTSDGQKTAIYAAVGTVGKTSSGTVAPPAGSDVVTLVNQINTAIAAIPANYNACFAPAYSTSGLYSVGQYVTYNGNLYRSNTAITTAETWTAAHWTQTNLGADVYDLKSAIDNTDGIEVIQFVKDHYIATNENTVDITDINVSSNHYMYAVIDCVEGDEFTITGSGGNIPRLFCFIKSNGDVISESRAEESETLNEAIITAPISAAKLVINSNASNTFAIKGTTSKNKFETLDEKVLELINLKGENLISVSDFTVNENVSYVTDATNGTITITNNTVGTYNNLATPNTFIQSKLKHGRIYRLYVKAIAKKGRPKITVRVQGKQGNVNATAAKIDLYNTNDGFVDFVADEYMNRIALFVSYQNVTTGSVTEISEIWLKDYTLGIDEKVEVLERSIIEIARKAIYSDYEGLDRLNRIYKDFYPNLPYVFVPYIEVDGDSYFDTGYHPGPNTRVVLDYMSLKEVGETFQCPMGVTEDTSTSASGDGFYFIIRSNNSIGDYVAESGAVQNAGAIINNGDRNIFDLSKNEFKINNVSFGAPYEDETDILTNPVAHSLYLLARNHGSNLIRANCTGRLYEATIYLSGAVRKHFVPVYNSLTQEYGLLETVANEFYSNSGTGTITSI